MPSELVTVSLFREFSEDPWGFAITGGKDVEEPLTICDVIHGKIKDLDGRDAQNT